MSLDDERLDQLRLLRTENIGPRTFYTLIKRFGSAREALLQLPFMVQRLKRLKPLHIPSRSDIAKELAASHKQHITLLSYEDAAYPALLRSCEDAPPFLSVRGQLDLLHHPFFALVGARNGSLAGQKLAHRFAQELGKAGWVIVSGLARGIDTAAHNGSYASGTAAVLAGGLDHIYPPENKPLYDQISEKGLLLSEMPLGTPPSATLFPRRNRLISGMARGTLVVEAALKSGSLITARYAAEQGRDVFAIPGHPLDPRARGVNHLLKEGAHLVQDPQDILDFYRTFEIQPSPKIFEASSEIDLPEDFPQKILELLTYTPLPLNEIAEKLDISLAHLRASLVEIEIAGYLVRHSGNCVSLSSPC